MAVSSNSPSKPISTPKKNQKQTKKKKKETKKKNHVESQEKSDSPHQQAPPPPLPPCSSPGKRKKSPGIRVRGGRIYDSENGKCCHQCRQKTRDFVASCKNQKDNKPCTINFCYKCLFNRYGEKAVEVAPLVDWKCPRCRGICNCSFCMKKRGRQPTGILVHTAKSTGFSSVSELLHVNGTENVGASPKNPTFSKEPVVASPKTRKVGKGKSCVGKSDSNLQPMPLTSDTAEKKIRKSKRKELEQENSNDGACEGMKEDCSQSEKKRYKKLHISKEISPNPSKKEKEKKNEGDGGDHMERSKKSRISKEFTLNCASKEDEIVERVKKEKETKNEEDSGDHTERSKKSGISKEFTLYRASKEEEIVERGGGRGQSEKMDNYEDIPPELINKGKENDEWDQLMPSCNDNCGSIDNARDKPKSTELCKLKNHTRIHKTEFDAHIPLPRGIDLTNIAGFDLPAEDVGHALQFLEFCNAFGKVLNLKKGQPEAVLRELTHGCGRRRGQYSSIIHIHIQLLSFIRKEAGEESPLSTTSGRNSWLQALGKCISESRCAPRELPLGCFDRAGDGYEKLDSSKKLRLLNFLCDETLGTADMRVWIDEHKSSKYVERMKEAKEKILAARDKERRLKEELHNEVAKAILSKNNALLSISEHEDLISKIKIEAAKAHEATLEAMDMAPKKKQRSDAVRTEPILLDGNGQAFWRLGGYSAEPNIFLQDMGRWDSVTTEDKWFTYDVEQKKMIENYISSLRLRRRRTEVVQKPLALGEVKQV